jgi:hypothetical protein
MTKEEAFTELTSQRGWYRLCKIKPNNARAIKRYFIRGTISTDMIYNLLSVAGYEVKVTINPRKK